MALRKRRKVDSVAEELLTASIRRRGWRILPGVQHPALQPDLVAQDAGGSVYVFEIKGNSARGTPSFSDLAQIRAYGDAVRRTFPTKEVRTVFLTAGSITPNFERLSQDLGVHIMRFQDFTEEEMDQRLQEWLPESNSP